LISIHKQFPKIDPASNDNYALRMAAKYGHLSVVQFLISIQPQFPKISLGIEAAIKLSKSLDLSQLLWLAKTQVKEQ